MAQYKMIVPDNKINAGGRVLVGLDLAAATGLDLTNIHAVSWDTETGAGEVEYSDGTPNAATTQAQADAIMQAFADQELAARQSARDAADQAVAAADFLDFGQGSIGTSVSVGP